MGPDQEHAGAVLAPAEGLDHLAGELGAGGVGVHQHKVEPGVQGVQRRLPFGFHSLDPGALERLFGQCLQRGTENQNPLSRELGGSHRLALASSGLENGLSRARPIRTSSARLGSAFESNGVGMSSRRSEGAIICGVTMIRSSL